MFNLIFHTFCLILTFVIGANILPSKILIALALIVVVVLLFQKKLILLLSSLAFSGLPFIGSISSVISLRPTQAIAVLNIFLVVLCIVKFNKIFMSVNSKGIVFALIWWLLFLLIYTVGLFFGPNSDYSIFCWQYLFIYGNYFALAGIITSAYRIKFEDIIFFGVIWFSFMYPILNGGFYNISSYSEETIGLRAREGLDAIGTARTSGMLLLSSIGIFLFSENKIKKLPLMITTILISFPLAWFSYTRQVYVAIAIIIFFMFFYILFANNKKISKRTKYIAIFSLIVFGFFVSYLLYDFVVSQIMTTRIGQDGLKINRLPMWMMCIELIIKNPVMGLGVGGFQKTGIGLWPHNWFIEAWLELGILGFFMVFIASFMILMGGAKKNIETSWLLFSALSGYFLLVAQVSADIPRNAQIIYFIVISFYIFFRKNVNNK